MAIKVQSGNGVNISHLGALCGVLESDSASVAGLIIRERLGEVQSCHFHRFTAEAGDLDVSGVKYSRMQMKAKDS